jgi:hypothetical protein
LKMRIATLSLLVLCLALTASAQTIIYSEGPIDGNDNAFFVTGPLYPNFVGSTQDISNGFMAANSGTVSDIEWGEWSVGAPTSFAWSLSTDTGTCAPPTICGPFTQNLGNATVAQNPGNSTLLFFNMYGYGVYSVKVAVTGGPALSAGSTYWLTISNATDGNAHNPPGDGTQAWDVPDAGSGGPAICSYRQSGTIFPSCGVGGESFTISSGGTTPEPSSIMLFGSGILGLAGVLRRKLTR